MAAGDGKTLVFNKNPETRKLLVGIAQSIKGNALSYILSKGTDILSTETEMRDTKQVNVLLPLLLGVKKVSAALTEATTGAVSAVQGPLAERIIPLANELMTNPMIYRPRDAETLAAEVLLERYQNGFITTAYAVKDNAYFRNICNVVKTGLSTGEKGTIVNWTPTDKIVEDAQTISNLLRVARAQIIGVRDSLIQHAIKHKDVAFIVRPETSVYLENDARYNIRTDRAVEYNGVKFDVDGDFDGSDLYISKQLPKGVDAIVMVYGSATSAFAIRNYLNFDKVPGVQAYKVSLEFDEGTGVWMPNLITILSSDATTWPAQLRKDFPALDLETNVDLTPQTATDPA